MNRYLSTALAVVTTVALAAPAFSAPRVPQIAFNSASLQTRLNGFGESINVLTQQEEGLVWGSTVSSNATMTIQFELTGNPHSNSLGVATLSADRRQVLQLCEIFPADIGTGAFAVASFRAGGVMIVNRFGPAANLLGTVTYTGVNRQLYSYYLDNPLATWFSHEFHNLDDNHKIHSLSYAGTGENKGSWWMAWEDAAIATYANADYADAIVFMESVNPTPVSQTTWSSLKARFR